MRAVQNGTRISTDGVTHSMLRRSQDDDVLSGDAKSSPALSGTMLSLLSLSKAHSATEQT